MLTADEFGQIAALLLLGAVAADLIHTKIGMRPVRKPDRSRSAADLFHHLAMFKITKPCSAVFLFHSNAQHAQRPEFAPEIGGKIIAPVDFRSTRRNLGRSKPRHRFA